MNRISRRHFGAFAAASLLAARTWSQDKPMALLTRPIPSTGEQLPAVGLGTASVFDNDDPATRTAAAAVVKALVDAGGRLIDTASSYGDAETVLGAVLAASAAAHSKVFLATKLESPDAAELKRSLARLATPRVDLLQLHNVHDPAQSMAQFKAWKAQGLCRYIGITSTYHSEFGAVESVMARERPDFVQVDYSIDNREAERRILPLAAESRIAVLIALPLGRARLFQAVRGKTVPDWAAPFAGSWAQFFLKYLLADTRVTAVIPGTSSAAHMADNLGAMRGRLPDPDERKRMLALFQSL